MSPDDCPPDFSVLCAEVTSETDKVEERVIDDIVSTRLLPQNATLDTKVMREPFGYPVYTNEYQRVVLQAQEYLSQFQNLHLVGRSAEFEHKETDDNFATAIQVVGEIVSRQRVTIQPERKEVTVALNVKPLIYAVILTYNHIADTLECLKSLAEQLYGELRVLVVDNGSNDHTPALVREHYPDVQVVENGQNLGVPRGYNVGFSMALEAGAECVLMLNNDTIVAPDMVQKLLESIENDPSAGIAMPKVLYHDRPNVIWAAGGRRRIFPPAIIILGEGDDEGRSFVQSQSIEFAIGCGLLIHRRAFERAGLFDPGYFFYFEDWDFSERVRAHGLTIQYVPTAKLLHKVSRTTRSAGQDPFFYKTYGESATRFYRRYGRPVIVSLAVHLSYIMLREVAKGNFRMLKHFMNGVRSGLTKPLGRLPAVADMSAQGAQVRSPHD
jgi:GT2 family glycosyltransferase